MADRYFAYSSRAGPWTMSFAEGSAPGEVLPRLQTGAAPFAVADDLATLEEKAYAHLGRHPDDSVHLTDAAGQVHKTLRNESHWQSLKRQTRLHARAWALLALGRGVAGLGLFALATLMYLGVVPGGIENELEGAVLCEIILILALVLVVMYRKVQEARERAGPPPAKAEARPASPPEWSTFRCPPSASA